MKIGNMLLNASKKAGEISFSKLTIENLPFLIEVRNEIRDFLHDNRKFSIEECQEWFLKTNPEFWLINFGRRSIGYFRTGKFIDNPKTLMVGADIHSSYRGRGLGQISWNLFLRKMFNDGVNIARLEVLETNERAIYIYRKIGFKEISNQLIYVNRNNEKIRSLVMEYSLNNLKDG